MKKGEKIEKEQRGDREKGRKTKGNKAGYTATSCGWVGGGGFARFPTF